MGEEGSQVHSALLGLSVGGWKSLLLKLDDQSQVRTAWLYNLSFHSPLPTTVLIWELLFVDIPLLKV
jgi:hypothetical protein